MSAIVKADAVDIAGELPQIFQLASALKQAGGFLPAHIRNEGEIVAIVLAGRELGILPMASLRSINLIKGRVTLAADMQLALMVRAGAAFKWLNDGSDGVARLQLKRPGQEVHVQTFTYEDAKQAQLTGGENWRKYPAAMLRARCVSGAAKAYFPDVLSGIYTPEELAESGASDDAGLANEVEFVVEEPAKHVAPKAQDSTSTSRQTGSATRQQAAQTDEFGLTTPASPCPVVSKQAKEYAGKTWMQVPEWMVCKWLEERHDKMSPQQQDWAMYISARRQARKAKEAREAEALAAQDAMADTNSEGGSYLAGDDEGAAAQGE